MTEAVATGRAIPAPATTTTKPAPAKAVARPVDRRIPFHLGVTLGVSAGIYAVSLAGVAALQANDNARLVAEHAPMADAVELLSGHHDQMEGRLASLAQGYAEVADAYGALADGLPGYEDSLAALAASVSKINGLSASMPSRATLPRVSRTVVVRSRPSTQATTGASGRP